MKRAGKKYNPYSQFPISSYFCTYSKKREKEKEREKKEGRKKREEGRKEERKKKKSRSWNTSSVFLDIFTKSMRSTLPIHLRQKSQVI